MSEEEDSDNDLFFLQLVVAFSHLVYSDVKLIENFFYTKLLKCGFT